MLKEGKLTAGEIADAFEISKPSISHHLDVLSSAELVSSKKKGQFRVYVLNATALEELVMWILEITKTGKENETDK